jgi:hypothetical protein
MNADKPPIEELHQFLEFQLPRQWAPVFGDIPLGPERKQQRSASLQISFMGPKLYVNTTLVILCLICNNLYSFISFTLCLVYFIIINFLLFIIF